MATPPLKIVISASARRNRLYRNCTIILNAKQYARGVLNISAKPDSARLKFLFPRQKKKYIMVAGIQSQSGRKRG
jgi:hypothetical protein